ncbi:MAG: hypothetical protein FJW30_30035 [Acidobacteria bacterium]|nr:hypothetical protein [Acidobacteriota bacterium]
MKRMTGLLALAAFGQPEWIPVYPGCTASPCEVTAAPGAVVEFFASAFQTAAIAAPVTSDGIGTVIKAHKDGVSVVLKVRERDGGALIITQSAAAQSSEGASVSSSSRASRYSATSTSSTPQRRAPLTWPAFFVSLDPLPEMPEPKLSDRGCLASEMPKAIAFMTDADDLLQSYASLFKRNGYAAEIHKKRDPSITGKMLYFDLSVLGRSETGTVLFHLTRYNALNPTFAANGQKERNVAGKAG